MKRPNILLLSLAIFTIGIVTLTGCGNSDCCDSCDKAGADKKPSTGADQGTEGEKDIANLTGPAAATYAFLDAARRGDDDKAEALLTPVAQEEIARRKLNVAPPGSDTAKFYIGEARNISESLAHVASRWTDVDEDGKPKSHEMTWILRRIGGEWRVGGVATVVFEGEPPLLLNFEDPDEMLRKQQLLDKEIARRIRQAAQQPPTTTNPVRR